MFYLNLGLLLVFKSQANELILLVSIYPTLGNTIQAYRAGVQSYAVLRLKLIYFLVYKAPRCSDVHSITGQLILTTVREITSPNNRNDK